MKRENIFLSVVFFIYLVFALLSIRYFLVNDGTIGHNWDWVIPEMPEYYDYMMNTVKYNWVDRVLGEPMMPLSFSTKIWFLSLSLTGNLLFGFKVSQIIVISTIVIAGMSLFFLLREILPKNGEKDGLSADIACFFGGFFYAFSPFLYADFIGGSGGSFQTYAIFPLVFLFFIRSVRTRKFLYIFLTAAVLSVVALNFHNLLFALMLLFFYPLVSENRVESYKNLFKISFVFFLINLYWIIPLGLSQLEVNQYISQSSVLSLGNVINNVPSIEQIVVGNGYIRNFYDFSINGNLRNMWYLLSFFIIGCILFFSKLRCGEKLRKESFFWMAVLVFSIILATGGKDPFGEQVIWLFENIFFFRFFRSPQFIIILPTLSIAMLTGIGARNMLLSAKKKKYKLLVFTFVFSAMLLWLYPSFISGDLGMKKLQGIERNPDYVDFFRLPYEEKKTYGFLNSQDDDFKVLWIPMQTSYNYINNSYQKGGNGGIDPHVLFSPHSPIYVDHAYYEPSKSFVWSIDDSICKRSISIRNEDIFDMMNVKYIILRKDVNPTYNSCTRSWDIEKIEDMLDDLSLNKVVDGKYITVYVNDDYLDHIYAVNKFSILNDMDSVMEEIEREHFDPNQIAFFSREFSVYDTKQKQEDALGSISKKEIAIGTTVTRSRAELLIANFEDDEKWENGIVDYEHHTIGESGFKAVSLNGEMNRMQRYVDLNLSVFDNPTDKVSIDLYIDDVDNMHENGMVIFFDSDGRGENLFLYDPRRINFKTGWNTITIGKDDFVEWGYPSWNIIKKIGVDVYSEPGKKVSITFDNWTICRDGLFDITKFRSNGLNMINTYDYPVFKESVVHETGDKKPDVMFDKVSPVKYELEITGKNIDPFMLVFLESYNPGWKLYKGNVNWLTSFFKKAHGMHLVANVYANAWYIEDIDDGEEYTMYYSKQKAFIISLLTSLFFLFVFVWRSFR